MKINSRSQRKDVLTASQLSKLATLLQEGGLVAFPTETVYALASDAKNQLGIRRIFQIKHRPAHQPLSVLLPEGCDLETWVVDVSPVARRLADCFWPGPLTLVLRKHELVLPELSGGGVTLGLRMPDHGVAQAILKVFPGGLASTSANVSTGLSSTRAEHVRRAFDHQLDMIIDGGVCNIGIESTTVDVTTPIPRLLRVGALSQQELQNALGSEIEDCSISVPHAKKTYRQAAGAELQAVISRYLTDGKSVAALVRHSERWVHERLLWITMPEDVQQYARVLYECLHDAEQLAVDEIIVESVPTHDEWSGIRALMGVSS